MLSNIHSDANFINLKGVPELTILCPLLISCSDDVSKILLVMFDVNPTSHL